MKLNFKGRAKQAGFTLIELIVVIVILGIMAATALPKFLDLGADARLAKAQAGVAAVKSAIALAQGAAQVQEGGAADATVTLGGKTYTLANGYPTRDLILEMAGMTDDYVGAASGSGGLQIATDADHPACAFVYTEASATLPATITFLNHADEVPAPATAVLNLADCK